MKAKFIVSLLSLLLTHGLIMPSEQKVDLNRVTKKALNNLVDLSKKSSLHNYEQSYNNMRSQLMERVMQSDLSEDDKLSLRKKTESHDNCLEIMMPCIFIAGAFTCGHCPINCISHKLTQNLIESIVTKNIQSKQNQKKD